MTSRSAFVLTHPAIREHPRAFEEKGAKPSVDEAIQEAMSELMMKMRDHPLQSEANYQRVLPGPGVTQGPPMSTCSVEYQDGGRNVLEQWTMRGERETVNAFRSFRSNTQGSAKNLAMKCEDAAPAASDDVTCLECIVDSSQSGPQVLMQFGTLQQCFALTVGGTAFCKSGGVVL
jgi:hypothetical protein